MAALFFLSSPTHLHFLSRPSSSETAITTATALSTSPRPPPLLQLSSRRGISVVTRAGPPTANTYIFAFLFPFSMLVATILTSIKIDQKLDQDFLEELAINEARMEVDGEEEPGTSKVAMPSKKSEAPRTRNRPKREA
ncbi:unnamed protein product [Rhodiola kirilowii]